MDNKEIMGINDVLDDVSIYHRLGREKLMEGLEATEEYFNKYKLQVDFSSSAEKYWDVKEKYGTSVAFEFFDRMFTHYALSEEALGRFMGSQTLGNITIDSLDRKLINDVYPTLFHYDITVNEEFSYIIDQLDSHSENQNFYQLIDTHIDYLDLTYYDLEQAMFPENLIEERRSKITQYFNNHRKEWGNWENINVESDKYQMVVPKTIDEILENGKVLDVDLSPYTSVVAAGYSVLLFIKYKHTEELLCMVDIEKHTPAYGEIGSIFPQERMPKEGEQEYIVNQIQFKKGTESISKKEMDNILAFLKDLSHSFNREEEGYQVLNLGSFGI